MPTATFIHDGNAIDYTPSTDTPAGSVVVQSDLIGVAKLDIAANTLGALAVTGVYRLPKITDLADEQFAVQNGDKIYWSAGLQGATAYQAAHADTVYLGKALEAAAKETDNLLVRLDQ